MIKNYLLDTNILLDNAKSIYGFEDNNVWICGTTTQELDAKKTAPGRSVTMPVKPAVYLIA